jgi:23S rRNA (adenine-N6)-dimethyltransferase
VGAQGRRSRPAEPRPSGKHFLRSAQVARELVAQTGVNTGDLVLEIGSGTGRITDVLADAAARVIAVELDAGSANVLRRRFRADPRIRVVEGDVLQVPLPEVPFRAFGNVPFGLTTAILRRLLDDPTSALQRADLVVQYEAARKRAAHRPSNLPSLGWQPWWELRVARHLPASAFKPVPSVDAGLLSIVRRRPLLPASDRPGYLQLLRAGFRRSGLPLYRSLRGQLPARAWKRMARERGLPTGATARDLDVFDWVALYSLVLEAGH